MGRVRRVLFLFFIGSTLLFFGLSVLSQELPDLPDRCAEVRKKPSVCEDGTSVPQTQATQVAIHSISEAVANKIKELEKEEMQKGRQLKVVLLGRQGTTLANFALLKDSWPNGQARSAGQLIQQAQHNESFGRGDGGSFLPIEQQLYQERDPNRKMTYSHLGIAIRNDKGSNPSTGQWTVINLLRKCKENSSGIYNTDYVEFFSDDMKNYNAQIMIPSTVIQDRIEKLFTDERSRREITENLRVDIYNAVARWDDPREANSNQWVLNVVAAAMKPLGEVRSHVQAQQVLKKTDYRPSIVLGTGLQTFITTQLAEANLPNFICFRNQRYGNYSVVELTSALSVQEYLQRNGHLVKAVDVSFEKK